MLRKELTELFKIGRYLLTLTPVRHTIAIVRDELFLDYA